MKKINEKRRLFPPQNLTHGSMNFSDAEETCKEEIEARPRGHAAQRIESPEHKAIRRVQKTLQIDMADSACAR